MSRWYVFVALVFGFLPLSSQAGPILTSLDAGTPVAVWGDGTGRALLLNEGALSVAEETPDGGWGVLGTVLTDDVVDSEFLGPDDEGAMWIAWRDDTMLYAGKLQGALLSNIVEAPVFSLSSFEVTEGQTEGGSRWIRVGADGFFKFSAGTLEAIESPEFSMSSLIATETGVLAFGTSAGMVVFSQWTDGGQWSAPTDIGEGTFQWACRQSDGTFYVGSLGAEESSNWESPDGLSWQMAPGFASAGTDIICEGGAFYHVHVSEEEEAHLYDAVTDEVIGVVATRVSQMGSASTDGDTVVLSVLDVDGQARVGRLTLASDAGPAIGGVRPDPARAGENVSVVGFRLMNDSTMVSLDGALIPAAGEDSWLTQLFLDENTPGGTHTVTVTTAEGEDSAVIDVLAMPPLIEDVSPDPIPLGALVVVEGKHLEQVTEVIVGDTVQEITTADLGAVVFYMNTETETGSLNLEVSSPTGKANQLVSVVMPAPEPMKANPNPVKLGQFLTIEGMYMADLSLVTLGGVSLDIVENSATSVTVHVSEDSAPGPQSIGMNGIGGSSDPFGPISVLPAEGGEPRVTEWMPDSVAPGQEIYIRGTNLDAFDKVDVGGTEATLLTSGDQERRLQIPEGLPEGDALVYLHGPESVQQGELTILKQGLPVPELSSLSSPEVSWGQELTIEGDGLSGVWQVYVGKTPHEVTNPENKVFSFKLGSTTVGGPQRVVAVGAGLSNELEVFVGLQKTDEDDESEDLKDERAVTERLPVDVEEDALPEEQNGAEETEAAGTQVSAEGCQSQSSGRVSFLVLMLLAMVFLSQRAWERSA